MSLFRPVRNENGIAMIGLILLVTAGVLSYTAFTASSYVLMMSEAKRQKRQSVAFEIIGQFGAILSQARLRFEGDPACAAGILAAPFCFNDGANQDCVENPVTGANICVTGVVPPATAPGRTVPVAFLSEKPEPNLIRDIMRPIHDFNEWYGEKVVMFAKALTDEAPVAHAVVRGINLPALAAAPAYTIAPTACTIGTNPLNSTCMVCDQAKAAGDDVMRPACIRLKVCVTLGGCNAAVEREWFWATIGVTNPLVRIP